MRIRTRHCPNVGYVTADGNRLPGSGYPSPSASILFDDALYAYIQDVHPSRKQDYNPVYQEVSCMAAWSGTTKYSYSPPVPPCTLNFIGGARYATPTIPYSPNWGALLDDLAAKLGGRIRNSCMLLLSLKEIGSTISMFRNPFNLLKPSWRKVANNHSASTLIKNGSNVWLEYLYGWKSFYSDLTAFARSSGSAMIDYLSDEYQQEALSRFSSNQTESGTRPNVYVGSITSDSMWADQLSRPAGNMTMGPCVRIDSISWKRTSRIGCWASSRPLAHTNKIARVLANYDVATYQSLRDLLWEIIPFSFVIDWFVDARGIWGSLNSAIISSTAEKWLGYSTTTDFEYHARMMPAIYYNLLFSNTQWAYKYPIDMSEKVINSGSPGRSRIYSRTAGTPPTTNFVNSLAKSGLSLTQCASGLSLIAQRIL